MLRTLSDPGQTNRARIAALLDVRSVWRNAPAAAQVLVRCLDDQDPEVAAKAGAALGRLAIQPELAVRALTKSLRESTNYGVRRSAADALGQFGEAARPAVPALVDALNDPKVSYTAATKLGELGLEPTLAVPALTSALQGPDVSIRQTAVFALMRFGEKARSAVPSLLEALNDPDESVRRAATIALLEIAPEKLPKVEVEKIEFGRRYFHLRRTDFNAPQQASPEVLENGGARTNGNFRHEN
jgi:HEAT repeat protein